MQWLNKLPDSVRSASGLEWTLWRKLPLIFVVGTVLPLGLLGLLHWWAADGGLMQARNLQIIDYVVAGLVLFHWSLVLLLGIGCVLVMLMKGPGYVADGFEVSHSEQPRSEPEPEPEYGSKPPPDDAARR